MTLINPKIFKAYDIRGIYPQEIDEEIVYKISRVYASILKNENKSKKLKIVVGSDVRISSPSLKKQVIQGLIDSGVDVIDAGLLTTPTFYFAVAFYGYDGGVQVSASHNPKEYNGLKLVRARAVPVSGETGIEGIKNKVLTDDLDEIGEKGNVEKLEGVLADEIKNQQDLMDTEKIKPFKIAVDTANGMGALDINAIFENLRCELVKLNFGLDGNFPVHQPDPLDEKNLEILKNAVLEKKADLGIAPDGDGDRYFFVDEKGEVVPQPILRGIMAKVILEQNPEATVCYDIRPGKITKDMIEEAGGTGVVTPVGHSLIKEKMIKENAIFGGESSGHYYYKFDYGTFEAPTVLVTKFLKFISEQDKPLSEIVKPYKKYFHSGEINSEVTDTGEKIKAIAEKYKDARSISYLDGISIEYDGFWFNVRPSNTEPKLRLNLEAVSEKLMQEKRDEIFLLIELSLCNPLCSYYT